jgi:hypothetical protein
MKDSKFIELLNLYVDHQIGAEDAALLEAEIQRSPERRRVYRQYCQMQKACATLADTFRTQTPGAGGKVIEFPEARRGFRVLTYATGVLAAAACLAVVLVNRHRFDASSQPANVIAPAEVAVQVPVAPARTTPARPALKPAFAGLVRTDRPAAALAVSDRAPFSWMQEVKLERVPIEDLWFQTRPTLQPEDLTLRSRRTFQGGGAETEMTAFRFQR